MVHRLGCQDRRSGSIRHGGNVRPTAGVFQLRQLRQCSEPLAARRKLTRQVHHPAGTHSQK
nr:MAG TPA: hypothetical protein [Caudoviricetes sp.]